MYAEMGLERWQLLAGDVTQLAGDCSMEDTDIESTRGRHMRTSQLPI